MSVSVLYDFKATVTEIIGNNTGSMTSANRTVTHSEYNETATLNSGSTPAATQCAHFLATLSGGALTIDLTALTSTNGATLDGTGLQPQLVRVKNLGANNLTIKSGASNGHSAFTATDGVVIPPSGIAMFFFNDGTQDIGASDKTWDLTGTTTQTSEWTIILG